MKQALLWALKAVNSFNRVTHYRQCLLTGPLFEGENNYNIKRIGFKTVMFKETKKPKRTVLPLFEMASWIYRDPAPSHPTDGLQLRLKCTAQFLPASSYCCVCGASSSGPSSALYSSTLSPVSLLWQSGGVRGGVLNHLQALCCLWDEDCWKVELFGFL